MSTDGTSLDNYDPGFGTSDFSVLGDFTDYGSLSSSAPADPFTTDVVPGGPVQLDTGSGLTDFTASDFIDNSYSPADSINLSGTSETTMAGTTPTRVVSSQQSNDIFSGVLSSMAKFGTSVASLVGGGHVTTSPALYVQPQRTSVLGSSVVTSKTGTYILIVIVGVAVFLILSGGGDE